MISREHAESSSTFLLPFRVLVALISSSLVALWPRSLSISLSSPNDQPSESIFVSISGRDAFSSLSLSLCSFTCSVALSFRLFAIINRGPVILLVLLFLLSCS